MADPRVPLLGAAFVAAGCFGRLAEESGGASDLDALTSGGAHSVGGLPDEPTSSGGRPLPPASGGEPAALPTGGQASSSGGLLGTGGIPATPPEPGLPVFPGPTCGDDCCPPLLTEVQLTADGSAPNSNVTHPHLSGDGAFVLLTSDASNLLPGTDGSVTGVFVYGNADGSLHQISDGEAGTPANGPSQGNAISYTGQFILFTSSASNLISGDTNDVADVFLHNQSRRETVLISRGMDGKPANGRSVGRDLSPDGRYAVFSSIADNLTPGDDNGSWDVFVTDLLSGKTERISMGPGDQQSNVFSGNHAHVTPDGRFVSFHSLSDSLVPGDDNGAFDVFVFDRKARKLERLSTGLPFERSNGNSFVLGMSDDARYFSGYTMATNSSPGRQDGIANVYFEDRLTGEVRRVNVGPRGEEADAGGQAVALSADGRYVAYSSRATSIAPPDVPNTLDSFLFDTQRGETRRLSQTVLGEPGDGDSDLARVSEVGRCYVFTSRASNLPRPGRPSGISRLLIGRIP